MCTGVGKIEVAGRRAGRVEAISQDELRGKSWRKGWVGLVFDLRRMGEYRWKLSCEIEWTRRE